MTQEDQLIKAGRVVAMEEKPGRRFNDIARIRRQRIKHDTGRNMLGVNPQEPKSGLPQRRHDAVRRFRDLGVRAMQAARARGNEAPLRLGTRRGAEARHMEDRIGVALSGLRSRLMATAKRILTSASSVPRVDIHALRRSIFPLLADRQTINEAPE